MPLQKQTRCLTMALVVLGVQALTKSHDDRQRAQPTRSFIPQWMADSKFSTGMLHRKSDVSAPLLTSYGQSSEDLFAEAHFFHNLYNGTFLELGALDGNLYSNTKLFEDQRGWRGVLVEPNREEFEKIPAHRPEAVAVHAAICAQSRNVHFVSRRTHKRTSESAGALSVSCRNSGRNSTACTTSVIEMPEGRCHVTYVWTTSDHKLCPTGGLGGIWVRMDLSESLIVYCHLEAVKLPTSSA